MDVPQKYKPRCFFDVDISGNNGKLHRVLDNKRYLSLLLSEQPKLHGVLAVLSAIELLKIFLEIVFY